MDLPKELAALLDPEQLEYKGLADRIDQQTGLTSDEEARFYDLHFKVQIKRLRTAYNVTKRARSQKSFNDRVVLSEAERKNIFRVLDECRLTFGIDRWDYRYMCFVNHLYDMGFTGGSPVLPKVEDMSFQQFKDKFAGNPQRLMLHNAFIKGLRNAIDLYKITAIDAIVGGSFTTAKDDPSDVDFSIVLPLAVFRHDPKGEMLEEAIKEFKRPGAEEGDKEKNLLDATRLPDTFTTELYMGYELLTLYGNNALDRRNQDLTTVNFTQRPVFRLRALAADIDVSE